MTENTIVLPPEQIERAVAAGDVRVYLEHPYLDLSGDTPMLVATNGHMLLAAPVEITGQVPEGWIHVDAIKAVRAASKKKRPHLATMYFEGGRSGTKDVMYARPTYKKMEFPEWRRVMPEHAESPGDIGFAAPYVDTISRALCVADRGRFLSFTLGRDTTARTKIKPIDPEAAIVVRSPTSKAIAILMPARVE